MARRRHRLSLWNEQLPKESEFYFEILPMFSPFQRAKYRLLPFTNTFPTFFLWWKVWQRPEWATICGQMFGVFGKLHPLGGCSATERCIWPGTSICFVFRDLCTFLLWFNVAATVWRRFCGREVIEKRVTAPPEMGWRSAPGAPVMACLYRSIMTFGVSPGSRIAIVSAPSTSFAHRNVTLRTLFFTSNRLHFHWQDVSGMPSSSRPRGMSGAGSGGSGRPAVTTPMSERQQMALLMQMTSGSNDAGTGLRAHFQKNLFPNGWFRLF